ncbi:hypothetical protein DRW03_24575 [Corallococcus sp. H22C18031201]|nr:hypothetical protein DRW03_24575 [Corallococcus sp. H22C18031201]
MDRLTALLPLSFFTPPRRGDAMLPGAPRDLDRRATGQFVALDQRESAVVELERDLVGLLLGVFGRERDDALVEVQWLAAR